MVTVSAPVMVNLRCKGTRKDGSPCNQVLMRVLKEHMEAVTQRIEIKCYRCGTVQ